MRQKTKAERGGLVPVAAPLDLGNKDTGSPLAAVVACWRRARDPVVGSIVGRLMGLVTGMMRNFDHRPVTDRAAAPAFPRHHRPP